MRKALTHPATIIASLALLVALGGSGYAISQLPKNSVGTAQLKKGAVTSAKIRKGAVTADRLAPGVLTKGEKGEPGEKGAKGDTGAQGVAGVPGTARAYGFVLKTGSLDAARSHGIAEVSYGGPGSGSYCVTLDPDIDVESTVAVVTAENTASSTSSVGNDDATIEVSMVSGCIGNAFNVRTYNRDASGDVTLADQPFFVVVP